MKKPRRPPMKKAAGISGLVQDLLHQRGFDQKLREYQAWALWAEVVGPQIAARTRPSRLRDGVMEVRVDHPVWMQQLQLIKPKILAQLNARLQGAVITDIFLKRGRIEAPEPIVKKDEPPAWKDLQLTPGQEREIEAQLADVEDPELRASLRRLLRRQAQLETARRTSAEDHPPTKRD